MKRLVLTVVLATLAAPQAFAAGSWLKSLPAAQKRAAEKNAVIFVDLYADWCGWCHKMEQEVFPSQLFQSATDKMVMLRLNTEDGAEGTRLAQQFQVTSLPTFLMITSDQVLAGEIRGYAEAPQFVARMKEEQGKYNEFVKLSSQESTFAKDYQKRFDLAMQFRARSALPQSEKRLRALVAEPNLPVTLRDNAYYELAVSEWLQKKYPNALLSIKKFSTVQTKGEPLERSRLLATQIYVDQGNLLGAVTELRSFKRNYPNSTLIGNVDKLLPELEHRLSAK